MTKKKHYVILSQSLPLSTSAQVWCNLAKIAEIKIRPKNAKKSFGDDPDLEKADAVITLVSDHVDSKFLDKAVNLKIVSNCAVGYNNIDIDYAKQKKIVVSNTPNVLSNATAELSLALMLAAARNFKQGTELLRTQQYQGWEPGLLLGQELSGSTLGILGYGRIGSKVAQKARALGMKVLWTTQKPRKGRSSLKMLLQKSDFISIHCPLNAATHKLFNTRNFSLMKPGSYLINTSRGEIIDERALVQAIQTKKIAGAALDVFCHEPKLSATLRKHPNIFVLPHLGSATRSAREGMATLALQSVTDVLTGRTPKNRVW